MNLSSEQLAVVRKYTDISRIDQDKLVAMLADPRHERRKIWTAYTFLTWHEQFFEKWN